MQGRLRWREALHLLAAMERDHGLSPNRHCFGACLEALEKAGKVSIELYKEFVNQNEAHGLKPEG